MKIERVFFLTALVISSLLLYSCATEGTNFKAPSTDKLQFGKITPPEALKLFGKPYQSWTKTTTNGTYLVYKYAYSATGPGSLYQRVLLLEFKDGKLNGYFCWSSFEMDKSKFNSDVTNKLKNGIGKLTKNDVMSLAGPPQGKALCPSVTSDFKDQCENNTEVWGWYMRDKISLWSNINVNTTKLIVSFGADGKISDVQLTESSDPK